MIRALLRAAAVAIAVTALLDPAIDALTPAPVPVTIALLQPAPAGAESAAAALAGALPERFVPETRRVPATGAGAACIQSGPCVLITDGRLPATPTDGATGIWAVRVFPGGTNVALTALDVPGPVTAAGQAAATVATAGTGVAGLRSRVDLYDGDVPVGGGDIAWTADGPREIEIAWLPAGPGLRRLRAVVTTEGDAHTADDSLDAVVVASPERLPILVYEPRPSWATTFVRRALEADPRWEVQVVSRVAPGVAVATGVEGLGAADLDAARLVVVGAPDALMGADVGRLADYVRVRGGTLLVLPDRQLAGPILDLVGGGWRERLEPNPVEAGPLRASELLVRELGPHDVVLASSPDSPVVTARPIGRGRVVVAGAMDAWRYRDGSPRSFERFWQALAADGAGASGAPIDVRVSPAAAAPGQAVSIDVRIQTVSPADQTEVSAALSCDAAAASGEVPVRLWPAGPAGTFRGRILAEQPGPCRLSVAASDPGDAAPSTGHADLLVAGDLAPGGGDPLALDRLTAAAGGRVVPAGDEGTLAALIDAGTPAADRVEQRYPMRSPWWLVPLVACLGAEWYLRRRVGLR